MKLIIFSQKTIFSMFIFGILALTNTVSVSGQKSSESASDKEKPMIVLVHGAFADGS
ncbi:hypothetical protein [Chryseobacterium wanjuense]